MYLRTLSCRQVSKTEQVCVKSTALGVKRQAGGAVEIVDEVFNMYCCLAEHAGNSKPSPNQDQSWPRAAMQSVFGDVDRIESAKKHARKQKEEQQQTKIGGKTCRTKRNETKRSTQPNPTQLTEPSLPDGLAHGEARQVPPLPGEARPPARLGEGGVEALLLGGGRPRLRSLLLLLLLGLTLTFMTFGSHGRHARKKRKKKTQRVFVRGR